jgi:hypothetical protein
MAVPYHHPCTGVPIIRPKSCIRLSFTHPSGGARHPGLSTAALIPPSFYMFTCYNTLMYNLLSFLVTRVPFRSLLCNVQRDSIAGEKLQ